MEIDAAKHGSHDLIRRILLGLAYDFGCWKIVAPRSGSLSNSGLTLITELRIEMVPQDLLDGLGSWVFWQLLVKDAISEGDTSVDSDTKIRIFILLHNRS